MTDISENDAQRPGEKQLLIAALIGISHSFDVDEETGLAVQIAESAKETITTIANPKYQGIKLSSEIIFIRRNMIRAMTFGGLSLDDQQKHDWNEFNNLTLKMDEEARRSAIMTAIKP